MSVHLLDANLLIALVWPAHEGHEKAQKWFGRNSKDGWATCPFTQAAVVRILSNPAFSRDAITPQQALKVLKLNLEHPSHLFWPDDIGLVDALHPVQRRLGGHQQITDAYLLGLAMKKKGKLATMDRAVMALLPEGGRESNVVTLI